MIVEGGKRWTDRGWVRLPADPKPDTWDDEETVVLPETTARRLRESLTGRDGEAI